MEGGLFREDKRRTTWWAPGYPSIRRLTIGIAPSDHNEFAEYAKTNPPDYLTEQCSLRNKFRRPDDPNALALRVLLARQRGRWLFG